VSHQCPTLPFFSIPSRHEVNKCFQHRGSPTTPNSRPTDHKLKPLESWAKIRLSSF
jgi:hypothetical protein